MCGDGIQYLPVFYRVIGKKNSVGSIRGIGVLLSHYVRMEKNLCSIMNNFEVIYYGRQLYP